jgi:transcriptional antiterminator RfaH
MDNDQVDNVRVTSISPEDKVTITKGAFKDKETTVQELGGKRIKLILPLLGYTINVKTKDV